MSEERIQELKDNIVEASKQLMVEVLRRDANLHEKGELQLLGEDYEEIDYLWPRASHQLGIAWNFYDEWIYARDHNFMSPYNLRKDEWPEYARHIADHLIADTEITDQKLLVNFDYSQRSSCTGALKSLFRRGKK